MRAITSVKTLENFGRTRLSKSFFMRDFLYSEISAFEGIPNWPDDLNLAIAAGERLCQDILEPLQDKFGRLAIRSSYRSAAVNGFGNSAGLSCAANESNYAAHIWDRRDAASQMGAMACVVIPSFWDRFQSDGDWQKLAWWIHDHLPYSTLYFFPKQNYWACNIGWHESPQRRIDSYAKPVGCLTKPDMQNHHMGHEEAWQGI